MTVEDLDSYIRLGKDAFDLLKAALPLLPKKQDQEAVQEKIAAAEKALQESKAEFAKNLGYHLCRCTYPPNIMLWNKDRRTNVCQVCGDMNPPPPEVHRMPDHEPSWIRARRGGY